MLGLTELGVVSLSTLGPSLEDVFLAITGQEIGMVRHPGQRDTPRRRSRRSAMRDGWMHRLQDEAAQAWVVAV